MDQSRALIKHFHTIGEYEALAALLDKQAINAALRQSIYLRAVELVERIREDSDPSMMELFLSQYGLSTDEGVALMCLAEALLRVPDGATMDALIHDKITPSEWGAHLGQSHSSLINASTWALFMTGKVLDDDHESTMAATLHGAIKRLGEPIIRQAVNRVMKELGQQFVLGEDISKALKRAAVLEKQGFTYSYDMLGEAAKTEKDAKRYHIAYADAITSLAKSSTHESVRDNPGISIKLSALHPRYETVKKQRVMAELVPRARSLAVMAQSAGIGLNIDAEEAAKLDLSLDIIEAILQDPVLAGWGGFGVVVQAYSKRAPYVIDWLYALAKKLDRHIMVRLVKGAYWDTEIKHAQIEGHDGFPVFTRKASTDVSYILCAKKLLAMTDRIYPQFATHSAHSAAAILEMAEDKNSFEFQRLHGMGEALHATMKRRQDVRCRVYAPVGRHKDLLAYLVRRLLENGANSSFVNQIVDETVPAAVVAADPFVAVEGYTAEEDAEQKDAAQEYNTGANEVDEQGAERQAAGALAANPRIRHPAKLYCPSRINSKGWDLAASHTLLALKQGIALFNEKQWDFVNLDEPGSVQSPELTQARYPLNGGIVTITNPANGSTVGRIQQANEEDVYSVIGAISPWASHIAEQRAEVLRTAANLFEENATEFFALLIREAGKTLPDAVGELREAVDFLRFYAAETVRLGLTSAGVFSCISPWNFPLAIFTGQVSAALAVGNAVVAKPAEATPLIAAFAVRLLHEAGVPESALVLLPGEGHVVGAALSSNQGIDGICFTGSTATAQTIHKSMALNLAPSAPLIAETGGLNAMIVDSTALPEQAIGDIVASAFQSAGQRCSALRVLYIQEDVADLMLAMLEGAMEELLLGDPMDFVTDVGPVIDTAAKNKIDAHIAEASKAHRLLKQLDISHLDLPTNASFVAPALLSLNTIADLEEEIFGPVLHVVRYKADQLAAVVADINATGYGLTFGIHSRIDDRVQYLVETIKAGNIYVNRNQIAAVVGSQPFGGEGLSGTGPKAGGPHYLQRLNITSPSLSNVAAVESVPLRLISKNTDEVEVVVKASNVITSQQLDQALASVSAAPRPRSALTAIELPGPTGESNRLSTYARQVVLCLGPGASAADAQARSAAALGCAVVVVAQGVSGSTGADDEASTTNSIVRIEGLIDASVLTALTHVDAVMCWDESLAIECRQAMAKRPGAILPLLTSPEQEHRLIFERHVCIDTTAAGGNAALLGE